MWGGGGSDLGGLERPFCPPAVDLSISVPAVSARQPFGAATSTKWSFVKWEAAAVARRPALRPLRILKVGSGMGSERIKLFNN